jgi:hypothetical protein
VIFFFPYFLEYEFYHPFSRCDEEAHPDRALGGGM